MNFDVTLYTRKNCSLCDVAEADLEELRKEFKFNLSIVDVDEDPDLQSAYDKRVPVIVTGSYTIEPPFDKKTLHWKLSAARDSFNQRAEDGGESFSKKQKKRTTLRKGERLSYWISKKYLLIMNVLVFLYVGLPFMAPVFMNAGLPWAAKPIYSVYSVACHQLSFRSWFLFGDQVAYPRSAAEVEGLVTFQEASGITENELLPARRFVGNEEMGYKVAYCERDVAIYAAMLGFGLLFAVTKRKIPPLPWYLWVLIGWGPIGLDGFSQLLSQLPSWTLWTYRESTPFLRTLTGSLFGFTTAWFGYPLLQETMDETRLDNAGKIARLEVRIAKRK